MAEVEGNFEEKFSELGATVPCYLLCWFVFIRYKELAHALVFVLVLVSLVKTWL